MAKFNGMFFGLRVCFTKEEYAILLNRFNYESGVQSDDWEQEMMIKVACPLCEKYADEDCKGCTLKKFRALGSGLGCFRLMWLLLEEKGLDMHRYLDISDSKLTWSKTNAVEAQRILGVLHSVLCAMGG